MQLIERDPHQSPLFGCHRGLQIKHREVRLPDLGMNAPGCGRVPIDRTGDAPPRLIEISGGIAESDGSE